MPPCGIGGGGGSGPSLQMACCVGSGISREVDSTTSTVTVRTAVKELTYDSALRPSERPPSGPLPLGPGPRHAPLCGAGVCLRGGDRVRPPGRSPGGCRAQNSAILRPGGRGGVLDPRKPIGSWAAAPGGGGPCVSSRQ